MLKRSAILALARVVALALTLPAISTVRAQSYPAPAPSDSADSSTATEQRPAIPMGTWRVGPFAGVARGSPSRGLLGTTAGRNHLFLGFQALVPILRLGAVQFSYGVQIIPLVVISGGTVQTVTRAPGGPGPLPANDVVVTTRRARTAYAAGISPFGFEIAGAVTPRLSLYGAAASGGLVFTAPFPGPAGQEVNFTLEAGGGALVRVGRARWVQIGYKYHHLSNAYFARSNPGLDGNVFYAGYQWTVRLPRE